MQAILDKLNPQQREAVEHISGPMLVVAGAGSGKTRVITTRIMYLIEQGVSPYQILAMTFTNKAAMEMKQRIQLGLDQSIRANDLTITTFHAFCARFLRRELAYLDRDPSFVIFDTQDQTACLKRVIRDLDLPERNFPAAHFRNKFSFLKNGGELSVSPDTDIERDIYNHYQAELKRQNALDFDDLLIFTCQILEDFPECRERYQQRFQHIMVDEYQDTNSIQARLVNLLLNEDRNLCVVGDEDQSIYGWRGADIRNILEFERNFPDAKLIKLEQNYRSTQRILDYANTVISRNNLRKPKKLWTAQDGGAPITIRDDISSSNEAEYIVQTIKSLARKEGCEYSDFAILFRSNYLSRGLEDMFRRYGVPYQLIGGLKFYDRKEIKDLLAFMRIVVNPKDWTSFTRAIGVPPRGVGAKSLDKLFHIFAAGHDIPAVLDKAVEEKVLSGRSHGGIKEFRQIYRLLDGEKDQRKPAEWLDLLIETLDYQTYLEKSDDLSVENRVANIEELLVSMQDLEKQGIVTLAQFMDFSSLVSDQDTFDDTEPKVSMMTVHAAKGLEFNTVFVMGLEEGVFPNQRALVDNADGVEEERRLFYVAVTRARQRLFLTYARRRQTYGSFVSNPKSRFLVAPGEIGGYTPDQDPFLQGQDDESPKKKQKLADLSDQIARMKAQIKEKTNQDVDFSGVVGQNEPATSFKRGDVVRHPKFGNGTVTMVRGKGDLQTLSIYFPGKGSKTLVARMAKLEKVISP